MPGDGPYSKFKRPRVLFIYDDNARESVSQIAAYMESIHQGYEQSFGWKLDEREALILTSPRQQVANAYATFTPNLESVWFPSGGALLEYMAESSWAMALATHETAHLYQLNAKGDVPAFLKRIVGNALIITPFWPIVIHPNIVTPTFLIEGNAVMNESRFNIGGRLHSGEARALVLAQIKAGDIDPNRLINNQFRFPYGENPYLQGAYFQAHLASKHGIDKTNQFFVKQGDHYLWPLILNKTFREHFGASYPQEIREYVREMQPLADHQQITPAEVVSQAQFISPLNHDKDRIFFMQSDGVETPELVTINKQSGFVSTESRDLSVDKVFWLDGAPAVATSDQHDLHHIEYGLYAEGARFIKRHRGQIISDMRGGHVVGLDAVGWLDPKVMVDDEFYDVGHSQPISDNAGNVYYFRQDGSQRVLYKNRQPVFKYDGYFGKLTEVTEDGRVLFIANTDYGSSLYEFQNQEVRRLLDSDRVVDARWTHDSQYAVVEVTAKGHEVKLTEGKPRTAAPAIYTYGFPTSPLRPAPIEDIEQAQKNESRYNSWQDMRYSSMDLITGYEDQAGFELGLGMNFADPLEYQAVSAGFVGSQFDDQNVYAQYSFTKYLPQFTLSYWYNRDRWKQHDGVERFEYNQRTDLGIRLPLLRWRHWDASISTAPSFEREDSHYDPSRNGGRPSRRATMEDTYSLYSSADISYLRNSSPSLNMYPLQSFELSYLNKLETRINEWKKYQNSSLVQSQYTQSFPLQFAGTLAGAYAWAERHDVDIDYNPYPLNQNVAISRLTPHDEFTVRNAGMVRLEVAKTFDLKGYSPRIPLGLDRLAPFVVAQGIFMDSDVRYEDEYPANIFEWGYGVDLQLLLLHLGSAKLRFLQGYDTRNPERPSDEVRLMSNIRF